MHRTKLATVTDKNESEWRTRLICYDWYDTSSGLSTEELVDSSKKITGNRSMNKCTKSSKKSLAVRSY